MICILDASFAIQLALHSAKVPRDGLNRFGDASLVLAPSIFVSEVGNAFWKYYTFGDLSREQCREGLERAQSFIDIYVDDKSLVDEAFIEACNLKHPVYDLIYLVLARRKGAHLLTLDKKLQALADKEGIY